MPGFDTKFTKEQIKKFPKQVQDYLKIYAWLSNNSGKYCLCSDYGNYFSHSNNPNSRNAYYDEEEVIVKATKDIEKGEEITGDYGSFKKYFKED